MELISFLQGWAAEKKVAFGVCHAGRLDDAPYADRFTPFVNGETEKRVNPAAILPHAKSIIVVGMAHAAPATRPKKDAAVLSTLGFCDDYHTALKKILRELMAVFPCRHKILVDSGTLDERALAVRAGLGFYGRNGLVISPVFGSYFNIGCVLTDLPVPDWNAGRVLSVLNQCPDNCRRCVEACPGGALNGRHINAARCVSYLTQKEGVLSEEEMRVMGRQLYGCDLCRVVCPFNKNDEKNPAAALSLADWLTLLDGALAARYAHTAMGGWRGADLLRRNALIVLGNLPLGHKERQRLRPLAQNFLEHPNPGVRAAARYAIKGWM